MTVNIWDLKEQNPLINRLEHHTEFVVGLDFNMFIEGQIGSCSWDESCSIFDMSERTLPPR